MIVRMFKDVLPKVTSGTLTVGLASFLLFAVQEFSNIGITPGIFSVGADVFENGHAYILFIYPLHHKTGTQLFLSTVVFLFLSGSLERGFGTVRFLIMVFLLSTTTGLAYALLDLLQGLSNQAEGLLPTALSCMALTTMHTKMTRGFLCGVSFPTIALPWVFLIITNIIIPNAILPCNIVAILTGWMYGRGWFSLLQMSESRACKLEKKVPFKYLKAATYAIFVPASTEERREILHLQASSSPSGNYPVQAYAPASSAGALNPIAMSYDGWTNYNISAPQPFHPVVGQSYGHFPITHGHPGFSHNHSHNLSNLIHESKIEPKLNIAY